MPKPRFWRRMRAAFSTDVRRPLFNVASNDGVAEVYLYGDVCEQAPVDWWGDPIDGLYISLQQVMDDLEGIRDANEIIIHLNSSGGDLFAGIAIHNLLREFNGRKTVIVDGLAASAASVIMCAADKVQVHPGSMVMIHNVLSFLCGYYATPELRDLIASHEAAELSIMRIYGAKCHKPENELKELIDATTWYVGQDAIDAGFADELIERDEPSMAAEVKGDYLMVAGVPHLIANLGQLPPWLATSIPDVANAAHGYTPDGADAPRHEEEDGMTITNAAELRSAYPELVAAVEAEAAASERERIRSIQNISAQIRNAELVNRAMFEEPMSAADLAYAAIQADNRAAEGFLSDLSAEAEEIKDDVEPLPVTDATEQNAAIEQAAVNEVVALYNDMNGRC